jgi:hypothetical protein
MAWIVRMGGVWVKFNWGGMTPGMTNVEIQMTNEIENLNDETRLGTPNRTPY